MPHDKINTDKAKCPVSLDDVDLFEDGAQNFWYESYEILHKESPVHRIPGAVSYTHLTLPTIYSV